VEQNVSSTINQWVGNIFSAGAIVSTAMGWLPAIAAAMGGLWYLIQIYESATVQRWVATRRIRKIARMKARVMMLEARHRAPLRGLDPLDDGPDAP